MRFLIDAQLPRRLCTWLREAGHDVIHTLDLPLGNATPDSVVLSIAQAENRVVVTLPIRLLANHAAG
jgi:predicted nuclease of predicted toxin-antitoxin system